MMPPQRYKSFEELARVQREQRSASASRASAQVEGAERLWVQVDVAAHAEPSAVRECRSLVLEWLREGFGDRLPRGARRHRPFSHRERDALCRAVRVRSPERDLWAVQVERMPGPGEQVATSLTVASLRGQPTRIGVEVHDRSVVPGAAVEQYPSGLVAEIAGRIPLLQNGGPFVRDPILLDTEEAMGGFVNRLVDPARDMPFAVVSIPPEEPHADKLANRWTALARALAGLAVVWVLPPPMTFRLSDAVGRSLSVFKGAWRFYRPGFNDRAEWARHPLVLGDRLSDERGLAAATTQFQRLAAEERLRVGHGDRDTLGFDAIAGEAAATPRGMQRLVALLRKAIRRNAAVSAGQRSPANGTNGSTRPDRVPRSRSRHDGAAVAAEQGKEARSGAGEGVRSLRRKLAEALDKARKRGDRYEQAQQRAEAAEAARDQLRQRVEQLSGLVRSLGGDPDAAIPFPVTWDQVAEWCDQSLAGRVSLTGSAKRELNGAEFLNVGLAARCLSWLGREYRDGRLHGGAPDLHDRIAAIDEGVYNLPCGGDAFECTWNGNRHMVDWHIKNGTGTRDPRRCLRIYYFWDDDTRSVVVASMPSHRRNART